MGQGRLPALAQRRVDDGTGRCRKNVRKSLLESGYNHTVAEWTFLTNHARALLCIAHDPGVRLRDIADAVGITERSAFAIVTDLTEGGYVSKHKEGRRNRYQIQSHLPLRE